MLLLGKSKARHKAHADQRPNRRQQANPKEQPRQHAFALDLRLRHVADHRQKHADEPAAHRHRHLAGKGLPGEGDRRAALVGVVLRVLDGVGNHRRGKDVGHHHEQRAQAEENKQHRHLLIPDKPHHHAHRHVQPAEDHKQLPLLHPARQHRGDQAQHRRHNAHHANRHLQAAVAQVVDKEVDIQPARHVVEHAEKERQQDDKQRLVLAQVVEGVADGHLFRARRYALFDLHKAVKHQRQAHQHHHQRRHKVAFIVAVLGEERRQLREEDIGAGNPGVHPEHRRRHRAGALGGVVGHHRRHRPERDIGDGVQRPPQDICHPGVEDFGGHVRFDFIKRQQRDAGNQQRRDQQKVPKLAEPAVNGVHYAGKQRIVNRVPRAGKQEDGARRQRRDPQHVGVKVVNKRTH